MFAESHGKWVYVAATERLLGLGIRRAPHSRGAALPSPIHTSSPCLPWARTGQWQAWRMAGMCTTLLPGLMVHPETMPAPCLPLPGGWQAWDTRTAIPHGALPRRTARERELRRPLAWPRLGVRPLLSYIDDIAPPFTPNGATSDQPISAPPGHVARGAAPGAAVVPTRCTGGRRGALRTRRAGGGDSVMRILGALAGYALKAASSTAGSLLLILAVSWWIKRRREDPAS